MSETIQLEKTNHIAFIKLNRPEAYNAFTREMALELISALDDCDADPTIRVISLSANGKAFCAGQDLKEVSDPERNIGFERIVEEHYNAIIRRITKHKKPVIAAVNGVAAGAGANIALACDIVLASNKACFIQAFSKIGLIPDSGGTYILPRLIGYAKAKALGMLGDKLSAQEAENMGMIYKCVDASEFEEKHLELANQLASLPPLGIQYTKKLFESSMHNSLDQQLELEKEYQVRAGHTNDYHECVKAFIEKRKPEIKGT
jgi:2-(1,2-epoxy-1,2-dihydrophenyl)acetyl-CoA isomerase